MAAGVHRPDPFGQALHDLVLLQHRLRPYVGGESVPYAALHLSQQAETFYFSREPKGRDWALEPHWKSITGWTQGLLEGHISPDYLYDRQFTPRNLARYKLLVMLMSPALSEEQCRTALGFAKEGGTLVLGIGAGAADEWGETRSANPLEAALGFHFEKTPTPAANETVAFKLTGEDGRPVGDLAALCSPLKLRDAAWKVRCIARRPPPLSTRERGRG